MLLDGRAERVLERRVASACAFMRRVHCMCMNELVRLGREDIREVLYVLQRRGLKMKQSGRMDKLISCWQTRTCLLTIE
jgi:hypothetical protein